MDDPNVFMTENTIYSLRHKIEILLWEYKKKRCFFIFSVIDNLSGSSEDDDVLVHVLATETVRYIVCDAADWGVVGQNENVGSKSWSGCGILGPVGSDTIC